MDDQTTPNAGPDNRGERRMRVLKSARIVFNGGYSSCDCRVKNLSSSGALLQAPSMLGIPTRFEIDIDKSGNLRPCTTVWRTDTLMGVAFDDASTTQPSGAPRLRLVETTVSDKEQDGSALAQALKSA